MAEKYDCSAVAIRQYAKKIGFDIKNCKEYKLTEKQK